MSRAPHLGRLLCRFKFEPQHINHEVKNCGKTCASCPYLLKAYLYQFNWVNKTFLLKNFFNCESSDLIFVFICEECRIEYIGEKGCLVKERINIYRQHIRRSQLKKVYVLVETESFICFLSMINQENKSIRKSYEDDLMDKFKPWLNKNT